jgi:hypothetical protein
MHFRGMSGTELSLLMINMWTVIEQSLYYRRRHEYGEMCYIELCVESVYVKRWEGPSYREPPTAIVKAPKPGPSGLRPNFRLRI